MGKPVLKYKISKDKVTIDLHVTGDLSVQYAEQIKTDFLQLLESMKDVCLNLEKVSTIDVTGIQLIYALKSELEKQEKKFLLIHPDNVTLQELLEKTGVLKLIKS